MSASPAGAPNKTPNGGPPPRRRPPPKANPLNQRHRPSKQIQKPKPAIAPPSNREQSIPLGLPPRSLTQAPPSPTDLRPPDHVLPIKATKRELLAGMRFHVARMISKDTVDITDEKEWERPIKLHRKDPRYYPNGSAMDVDSKEELIDEKQREAMEAAKAERQRIREEQAKQMAPTAAAKRKPQAFKKKVEQVYRADDTPEERKRQQLRYEEALPWHIEDFEEKKIWSAAYEAALSECHVMLVEQPDNSFRLVPLEKWYRFREKSTQKKERLDPELAEKQMAKGSAAPRWLMKNEEKQAQIKKEQAAYQNAMLYTRSGEKEQKNVSNGMDLGDQPEADPDANDIDFNVEEEFADDEENELFEGDDDTKKMAEEKLKRDQLNANVFDMKDEKEVDAEEEQQRMLAEVTKRLEKGTRKALLKREKNFDYATDSEEENPYSSGTESEDSETERLKEEERRKEEEAKSKADSSQSQQKPAPSQPSKAGSNSGKPGSGASSRGANTPSGRKEKHGDTLRVKAIKRPGSPNLSEQSGNESAMGRKRVKVKKGQNGGTGTATPRPGVPGTGVNPSRQGSFLGTAATAGSGSDTDGRPRIKLSLSQRNSRAGSPAGGSRAQSPPAGPTARSPPMAAASPPAAGGGSSALGLPTAEEIAQKVPKEGITVGDLLAIFRRRVPKEKAQDFIREVRKVAKTSGDQKGLMVLKNPGGGVASGAGSPVPK